MLMTFRLTHGALPVLALLLIGTLGPTVASADRESGPCSNKTIKGEYGFSYSGQVLVAPTGPFTQAGPVAGVAKFTYDGRGGLRLVDHTLYNGFLFPSDPFSDENTGTYIVKADCTATFVIDPPLLLTGSMVIMERGRIIHNVITNANTAITAVGIRQD
jgi:hypothetical protein